MNPEEASRGLQRQVRPGEGRGGVCVGWWGRDVLGRTLVHMNPEEASRGAPETGQSRGRARRCMWGWWGRDVWEWGRDVWG